MIQSFRKCKIDINDTLYSQIIRAGHKSCLRCKKFVGYERLQCAHIMSRAHYSTRFMLRPICNAVHLCATCHSWIDSCKDNTPIFEENARKYFSKEKNAYTFLVSTGFYTWDDLAKLYALSCAPFQHYKLFKKAITVSLREEYKKLDK